MGLTAEAYARAMALLLPPGRIWRVVGDSLTMDAFTGAGDELVRVGGRGQDLIRESDPRTADELLPEFERMLALVATGTLEERRARVVARLIARQRYRPVDFQDALAPLLGLDPEDVVVIERTAAQAAGMGDLDGREIFRFFIWRDPSLGGTYDLAAAQDLVDQIKPAHTVGHVIESVDFLCDDPYSLCDRDILGA